MNWSKILSWWKFLLDLPCPGCRCSDGDRQNRFCPECLKKLPFIDRSHELCRGCGGVMDGTLAICSRCLSEPIRPWQNAVAVMEYRDYARELIRRFKFQNSPELARPLGMLLAETVLTAEIKADLIIPLPLHWRRFMRRGYNQSALLAEVTGKISGIPVIHALNRNSGRSKQSQRNRRDRHQGMTGAFQLKYPEKIRGKDLLLLDDVLTTGATLHAAATALSAAEPNSITILVVARTVGHLSLR